MSAQQKVFDCDDLRKYILEFYPLRCKSCHKVMNRKFVDSHLHFYRDKNWTSTENKFCRGFCNWCCIYVFEHSY